MSKQYFVSLTETRKRSNGESYDRECVIGHASTIKSAKTMIRNHRRNYPEYSPRDFKVYDSFADIDPKTNHVPCVYSEE